MPETFGEADIKLRVRLDELQMQLDQAEAMALANTQRVAQAQEQAIQQANAAAGDAIAGDLAVAAAIAVNKWWLLGKAVGAVRVGLMAIPAVAAAVSAAAVGGAVLVVGALGLIAGKFVEIQNRAVDAVQEINRTKEALDGSRQSAEEYVQAVEKLPILGGLASQIMAQFAGNSEVADRKLMSLVGTIEDGEVKLKGWASLFGRLTGQTQAIEEVNGKLREMNALLDLRNRLAEGGDMRADSLGGLEIGADDAARLAGLEGLERVRAENEMVHRDRMAQIDQVQRALRDQTKTELDALQARQDAEEISAKQYRIQRAAIITNLRAGEEQIGEARRQIEADLARVADQRIADAKELLRLEEERARVARDAAADRVATQAQAVEMRAGGDPFGAEALEIELRRREAIRTARQQGYDDQIADLNRYYDALLVLLGQRQQQEIDRERETQQRKLMTLQEAAGRAAEIRRREADQAREIANRRADDLLSIESQITQELLRQAGRDAEAERERIEDDFGRRIRQAIDAGDRELAERLRQLRDVKLGGIDNDDRQEVGRAAQARDVSLSRSVLGGGVGGEEPIVREQRESNKTLKRIEENTREQRPARAG